MATTERIELRVLADGAPAAGAIVQVRRHAPGEVAEGGVIALIRTDAEGRASGLASLVRGEGKLEIIVIKPGFNGPYVPAEEQAQLGPFAPAARLEVEPGELAGGLQIDLVSKEEK